MRSLTLGRQACGLIAFVGLVVLLEGAPARGQGAGLPQPVGFDTKDQVSIRGTYYATDKGKKAPCALLLHEFGGNSQQDGWAQLGVELQKKGFAVLAFDFRGHGESTRVGPNFYTDLENPVNKTLKSARSIKSRDKVTYKDFNTPAHYGMMVNDIAAAKRFLDRRNDAEECNSSDLVVIGAEMGATLGALWMRTEWDRREPTRVDALGRPLQFGEPEGKHLAAAVWLSISPTLGSSRANVANWLRPPARGDNIPMYFITGEQDKYEGFAKTLHESVLKANPDKSAKLTGKKIIPGSSKLSGGELLGKKSLNVEELIGKYLEEVMKERVSSGWQKRNVENRGTYYVPYEKYLR